MKASSQNKQQRKTVPREKKKEQQNRTKDTIPLIL